MIKGNLTAAIITYDYRKIIPLFFILFLLIGLAIFDDYGVSWDEKHNRQYGTTVYNYILSGEYQEDNAYWNPTNGTFAKTHGPAFELFLVGIEKTFNLKDLRKILLLRHLVTFLFFYIGVFFFYQLCKYRFNSWKLALLGSLSLILHPRIFAHSFHNSIDIPFLSLFIISLYTLVNYLDRKTVVSASLHALACAILVDIRAAGIIIPFFTFIFVAADLFKSRALKTDFRKIIPGLLIYTTLLTLITVLLWPVLWGDPVKNFIAAFKESANVLWPWWELYFGAKTYGSKVPWHFTPVWMLITTPLIFTSLFFIGLFSLAKSLLKNPRKFYSNNRNDLIFLMSIILPLGAVAILKSTLFNGWRHFFFIYPGFLMLSLRGLVSLSGFTKKAFKGLAYNIIRRIIILIFVSSLIYTAHFIIRAHPLQNTYFNLLTGSMEKAKKNFAVGYWGVEFKEGYKYILNNDSSRNILFHAYHSYPAILNLNILTSRNRDRLTYTDNLDKAKYFISNYHQHREEYSYGEEVHSVKIGEAKFLVVQKLKHN